MDTTAPCPDPVRLRGEMVDHLTGQGLVSDARVAAAMRAVPRHLFVQALGTGLTAVLVFDP